MNKRLLGKTGFEISEISIGTWQVGGKWGTTFNDKNADAILHAAVENGINFIDTADVYSDGDSEKAIGKFLRTCKEKVYVATKCGRQFSPHIDALYQPKALRQYVEDSLTRLGLETLDLIQLHCPPTATYNRPEIFDLFNDLKKEGKILNMGVSVETIDEALKAIEYDNVTTVQIIFNMLRQRPAEHFFAQAASKNVGIIVRVPLASGLLTGKFSSNSTFDKNDHRNFNRNGEAFDKGETFSGVNYEKGLAAVAAIKAIFPQATNLSAIALKWILMFSEVSCVIPGASSIEQVASNVSAADIANISTEDMAKVKAIYDSLIWPDLAKEKW